MARDHLLAYYGITKIAQALIGIQIRRQLFNLFRDIFSRGIIEKKGVSHIAYRPPDMIEFPNDYFR